MGSFPTPRLSALLAALVFTFGGGGSAKAQTAAERERARALHAEGREAAAEEAWSLSIDRFRASLELVPRSTTAFSLAEVLDRSGDLLAAHALLSELLTGTYGELPEAALRRVRPLAQQVRRRIARLSVLTHAEVLRIDGEERPVENGSVGAWLLPGEHRIDVGSASRTLVLSEGDEQVVDLRFAPALAARASDTDEQSASGTPQDIVPVANAQDDRRVRRRRRALIITSALVLAGAGAFAAWYWTRPDEDPVWGRADALINW